ncbi:MAG: FAD-dependent monooxygenase [Desulfobacteraceae bacterium]|nr:FAD-dependent monooxygenase [Desulfobacteraceae bacterium]
MHQRVALTVSPREAATPHRYLPIAARKLGFATGEITAVRITRRSIDARSRRIRVNLELEISTDPAGFSSAPTQLSYPDVHGKPPVLVVGAGPAGLFAALRLVELGCRPVIIERGREVQTRRKDIARLLRQNTLDPDSNYGFGEGGAGAFSDGKLYTRSHKRGDVGRILTILHHHGAAAEILFEAQPHIGSNKLPRVIQNIRETILAAGGEIHFETPLTEFIIRSGKIQGVRSRGGGTFKAAATILATGHSARDIYHKLQRAGIAITAKAFAMGVRLEHPQTLIDRIQYHGQPRGAYLPPATYRLVTQVEGRGIYSFCMCPGGFIVPAATGPGEVVVNGMSFAKRNSPYANAGMVVEIRLADIPSLDTAPELAGLYYQATLEREAFRQGGRQGQTAPAQRLTDFVAGRYSSDLPATSYLPGAVSSPLHAWLPAPITTRLQQGFRIFGRQLKGFLSREAVLLAVESRTSSPVRIPRHPESLEHPQVRGFYPCGEGAGYAGGIVSSAIDGERCAEKAAAAATGAPP